MKVKIIKEVHSEKQRRWACAQDDPEIKAMCDDPMKNESDFKMSDTTDPRKQFIKRHLIKMATDLGREYITDEKRRKKLISALRSDPTAKSRIEKTSKSGNTGHLLSWNDSVKQLMRIIGSPDKPEITQEEKNALQNYVMVLAAEYGIIATLKASAVQTAPITQRKRVTKEVVLAWIDTYLMRPAESNPAAVAKRFKIPVEVYGMLPYGSDTGDPEWFGHLYNLRENKRTIKCKIRRNK